MALIRMKMALPHYWLQCDSCGREATHRGNSVAAIREAKRLGWDVKAERDTITARCGGCKARDDDPNSSR